MTAGSEPTVEVGTFTVAPTVLGIADGTGTRDPLFGSVEFRPRQAAVPDDDGITYTGPVVVPLDADGRIPVGTRLPAWPGSTCQVIPHVRRGERGRDLRIVPFDVPAEPGSTVALSDYVSMWTDPSAGTVYVRGPRGDLSVDDREYLDGVWESAEEAAAAADVAGGLALAAQEAATLAVDSRNHARSSAEESEGHAARAAGSADLADSSSATAEGHAFAAADSATLASEFATDSHVSAERSEAASEVTAQNAEDALALIKAAEDLRVYPLMSESHADGTATISGWLSSSRDDGTAVIRSLPKPPEPGDHWSINPLAAAQGRAVTSLDVVNGRLYSGFGDWNLNGDRVGVVSHDLVTGEERVEYFPVDSEAIEKVVGGPGGSLFVPHIDGNQSYWGSCGYASFEGGKWTQTYLPGQAIHVFDMCFTDEGLWACGSSIPTDQSGGTSALWFRPDGGEWAMRYRGYEDHGEKGNLSRFYTLATDGHVVRVHDRSKAHVPALEFTADTMTEIPRPGGANDRYVYTNDGWASASTAQKVIDGEVVSRPSDVIGVPSWAWLIHGGYVYYSPVSHGGIDRKELP